jgi:hypothetical protein
MTRKYGNVNSFLIDRMEHEKFKHINNTFYFTISSLHRNGGRYVSSSNFTYKFPSNFTKIKHLSKAELLSGTIPNHVKVSVTNGETPTPYLYLVITELDGSNIYCPNLDNKAIAVLRWNFEVGTLTTDFINLKFNNRFISYEQISTLEKFRVSIYDNNGDLFSFGNTKSDAVSFTNANPTVVNLPAGHGINVGDKLHIENFKNATTQSVRDHIEDKSGWFATVVAGNNVTIGSLDLSAEGVLQTKTIDESAYQLGRDVKISVIPNGELLFISTSSFSIANPTTITIVKPHGLTTGTQIKFSKFNNGTTTLINQLINQIHTITVTGVTTFTIPVDLTGEAANQQKTGTVPPYTLGLNAHVIIDKMQVSFDFKLTQKNKELDR